MRIALIYDAVYPWIAGGGEKHLYELAVALRDRGHEVHLFSMHYWPGPADMIRDGIHYHGLCRGTPLYGDSGRRRVGPPLRFAWGIFWRLPRYRLHRFDVIDVLAFPFLSVPVFWLVRALFARRVAWILTWLEVWGIAYWRRYLGRLAGPASGIERLAARLAPVHLCISPTTARRLRELLGVPPQRIHVIPRGFAVANAKGCSSRRLLLKAVCAGRLLDYKRIDLAIQAWPRVASRLPGAELHILGDGPERSRLERLAVDLGVSECVRFHGHLPDPADVLREIASASLLLQPSQREGQSLVVVEAMAAGTAVLAAEGPETAVADFLPNSEPARQALLSVEAGPEAWADRIVALLSQPPMLRQLGELGRARIRDLDWKDSIAPRIEELYRRLATQ